MNPIVSAGRHHNERPFTGRHQMSSRVLSRCFVRDTFNSPLALCLPGSGDSRYLLFPTVLGPLLPFFSLFPLASSLCPSRVSFLDTTSTRRGKRERGPFRRARPYLLSVFCPLKEVKPVTPAEDRIELNGRCLIFRNNARVKMNDIQMTRREKQNL